MASGFPDSDWRYFQIHIPLPARGARLAVHWPGGSGPGSSDSGTSTGGTYGGAGGVVLEPGAGGGGGQPVRGRAGASTGAESATAAGAGVVRMTGPRETLASLAAEPHAVATRASASPACVARTPNTACVARTPNTACVARTRNTAVGRARTGIS